MKEMIQQNIYALLTPITVLAAGLIISLLFPRLLPPVEFGVFSTLIAFTILFTGISDLGVPNTLIKIAGESFHSQDGHAGFHVRYLLRWKLVSLITLTLLLLLLPAQLAEVFLHDASFAYVMSALAVLVILYSITQFITSLFNSIARFEYSSLLSFVLNTSKLLFPLLFILIFGVSLHTIVIGLLAGFTLSALFSLWLFNKKFNYNLSTYSPPKKIDKVNSFLFYSTLLSWASLLSTHIDSLMLNYFSGPEEFAFFKISNSIVSMLLSLIPISSTFLLSFLIKTEAKKERELQRKLFEKSIKYGMLSSIPISFLVYLTANRIIFFFWPQSYMPAAVSLRILSLLIPFGFLSGISTSLFMSKGKMRELTANMVVFYIATWAIGLYLIPNYGLAGTALTFVLSYVLQAVVLLRISLRMLGIKFNLTHILKPTAVSLLVALIIILLNPIIRSTVLLFLIAGASFCVVYLPLLEEEDKKLLNSVLSLLKLPSLF
ncbi:MAG: oligosaccharide flippase family protein [Candidatus Micrarchaeia archaeon]